MEMNGLLLLLAETNVAVEWEELARIIGGLTENYQADVLEVAVPDEKGWNVVEAILTCVKKGVDHLIVVPLVGAEAFSQQEVEAWIQEEASGFRGMTVQFGEAVNLAHHSIGSRNCANAEQAEEETE